MSKRNFISKFRLPIVFLLLSGVAFADSNKEIERLLTDHEDGSLNAIAELNLLAKERDPHALSTLGFIYEHGINTPKDVLKAIDYYQQACDLGGDYGCGNAWYFYQYGIGVEKNKTKAQQFVEKVNKEGIDVNNANDLSITLFDAKSEAETDKKIRYQLIDYISRYLTSGDQSTQDMLTRIGFSKQDTLHLAKLWASDGDGELLFKVGHFYNFGYSSLAPEEKDLEALKWFRKAADKGEPASQNILGQLYEKGDWGIHQDPAKAMEWYSKAAESGDNNAILKLATIYYEGEIIEVNYPKALQLFNQSSDYSRREAEKYLSLMYYNGNGVKVDCQKSANLYENSTSGFSETLTRTKYIQLCESDKKRRNEFSSDLPKLTIKRISTFSGNSDSGVECELYFGVESNNRIPVENLRVGLKITTKDRDSEGLFEQIQVVAFKPFGFNSLYEHDSDGKKIEYEGSRLVPIYDKKGCDYSMSQFNIESASALVNGKPVDLLEKELITFKDQKKKR
ncbi:SEL1-like repeat protein [Morganella psychrotolerans]|uniref:Sel1 repeat family protein n=1 Tax=Morganella psychrotolerans TaxID=368603 RepID=A0A1B8HPK5_9GAMM|nr:SEL1-like repeat protein [Morganella psychrotolerans]OBU11258.1 hypothetical protein AYY17_00425 [Morganella psychrotolerans]